MQTQAVTFGQKSVECFGTDVQNPFEVNKSVSHKIFAPADVGRQRMAVHHPDGSKSGALRGRMVSTSNVIL